MEEILKVVPVLPPAIDTFRNASPLWHPPDAQGIYGGICIAQSINAAQATVSIDFAVHSMHGKFLLAGKADDMLEYRVSRCSDGRSFATRTVRTCQKDRIIFIAVISFARDIPTASSRSLLHQEPMPRDIPLPPQSTRLDETHVPYVNKKVGMTNLNSSHPHDKRIHQWTRTTSKISPAGGIHAHISALSYICDSYFVGTVPHVHNIWNFVKPPLTEFDDGGSDLSALSPIHTRIPLPDDGRTANTGRPRISMMVTLSHTMLFHAPKAIKADEWMLSELTSHWAGDGRGVATQKIWSTDGTLLVTCIQEGVIRPEDNIQGRKTPAGSRL
ncbi:hypothetical protein B0A52_00147 [Exophiala mesophila]|uniref:Acyl-CoA thioesterase II n=1 Tax=Exophiala mesophila TaxID=212818 RepID=A0A438NJ83_EXOME|nr:hypothetical protein B0A52_00147 [Exophiala mesophila]